MYYQELCVCHVLSLMCGMYWYFIQADPSQLEAELANGLIMGHAYSITAVSLVSIIISMVYFLC